MNRVLLFLALFEISIAPVAWAQQKVDVPIWNVGDRWVFADGTKIEVIGADQDGYVLENAAQRILYSRSTLNRTYILHGKKREPYKEGQRKLFNFPLVTGKNWKDVYSAPLKWEDVYTAIPGTFALGDEPQIFETYKVIGWEDVEVRAGNFKAIKIEYKRGWSTPASGIREGRIWYWYCPEVKNMIKIEYEKNQMWSRENDSELASFQFGK